MGIARVEALVRELLVEIGEDPEREGLRRTPARVAAALEFLVRGQGMSLKDVVRGAIFEQTTNDMVMVRTSSSTACASTMSFPSSAVATSRTSRKARSSERASSRASWTSSRDAFRSKSVSRTRSRAP